MNAATEESVKGLLYKEKIITLNNELLADLVREQRKYISEIESIVKTQALALATLKDDTR